MPDHPTLPPGERIYAIGDIHGRADLLERMLRMIERDAAEHPAARMHMVFLGDYIDRGPNSREVIERLLDKPLPGLHPVFLRGNHEEALLRFLDGDIGAGANWLQFGGDATLASYGVATANTFDALENLRPVLAEKFPLAHKIFLAAARLSFTCGDYRFVHAGIQPGTPLDQQTEYDQIWIREPFLSSKTDHGKIIVHGHTPASEPEIRPNRIGIDTGAFATGRLTCLRLAGREQIFLAT